MILNEQRQREWKVRLADFETSGLKMTHWCSVNHVNLGQMKYWMRKFKKSSTPVPFSAGNAKDGLSIYFGSDQSRFQILIYEKNKQLGLVGEKWTRTEMRFFKERANEMVQAIIYQNSVQQKDIGVIAAEVLIHYIQFRDKGRSRQKTRWKISTFWQDFLKGITPRRLTTALPDRSILRMRNWVNTQVSKSLAMMMLAYQDINDDWLREIMKEGLPKFKKEDYWIIEEFRKMYGKEQEHQYEQSDKEKAANPFERLDDSGTNN